jgi:hypothetical protein
LLLPVSAAKPAWRKSFTPAAASVHVTCHELADRLAEVAGLERILVSLVRLALDERVAQEARHLVA